MSIRSRITRTFTAWTKNQAAIARQQLRDPKRWIVFGIFLIIRVLLGILERRSDKALQLEMATLRLDLAGMADELEYMDETVVEVMR